MTKTSLTGQLVIQRMGKTMFTLYDFFLMNLFLHTAKKNSHSILIVINEYKTEPDLCSTDII